LSRPCSQIGESRYTIPVTRQAAGVNGAEASKKVSKISIVTPCLNAERFIASTVRSVLEQTAVSAERVELQYIVCDGGSTDSTLEIVRRFDHPALRIASSRDRGMYDALAGAFRSVTGDWVGYINAGDFYDPGAFETLLSAASDPDVQWISGRARKFDQKGKLMREFLPFRYRASLIRSGFYTRRAPFFLPWIQQESVFWHRSLHETIDLERLAEFQLAGDYFLWVGFSRHADLRVVDAPIGAFRVHPGQLSEDRSGYRKELARVTERATLRNYAEAMYETVLWHFQFFRSNASGRAAG
jgi:glycosyltransferase involved in cell wall biosynthesis